MVLVSLLVFSIALCANPPSWAPAKGYNKTISHIYFPKYNMYYDLQRGSYIYMSGSAWQVSVNLPSTLENVNLTFVNKIKLEIDTNSPQNFNMDHKEKYKTKSNYTMQQKWKQDKKFHNNAMKIKSTKRKK